MMFKSSRGIILVYGLVAATLITLDQMVKIWAIANLQGQPARHLIQGFMHLVYVENTGAAFGLLAGFGGAQFVLAAVKLVVLVAVIIYFTMLPQEPRFTLVRIPLVMIFAGGMGNLIDRVRFGFVVDMFAFSFIDFPVFNVADIFVTTGAFVFVFIVMFIVKDAPVFDTTKQT